MEINKPGAVNIFIRAKEINHLTVKKSGMKRKNKFFNYILTLQRKNETKNHIQLLKLVPYNDFLLFKYQKILFKRKSIRMFYLTKFHHWSKQFRFFSNVPFFFTFHFRSDKFCGHKFSRHFKSDTISTGTRRDRVNPLVRLTNYCPIYGRGTHW